MSNLDTLNTIDSLIDFSAMQNKYRPVLRTCKVCGSPIPETKRLGTVTCKASCRQALYAARRKVRKNLADNVEDFRRLSELLGQMLEEMEDEA